MGATFSKATVSRRAVLQLAATGIATTVVPLRALPTETDAKATLVHRGKLSSQADQNIVETNAGKVRGYRIGSVYAFRGIPYGAPTSGALRFAPPRPAPPWAGIRSCMSYGPYCPHDFSILEPNQHLPGDEDAFLLYRGYERAVGSEDCLRVNLWTPGLGSTGKRAVMVFMHGGGFTGGSGNDLQSYNGAALAAGQDVVVITHNHRLNVFGYAHLALLGIDRFKNSANVGLLDIVAVLEWIQTNIAEFGGDPNRVMIFGQSGGGGKVSCLMAMPAAKGLFHAAAVESGSLLRVAEPDASEELVHNFVAELGATTSNLSRFESASTEEIMTASNNAMAKLTVARRQSNDHSSITPRPSWGPVRDGSVLPNHPFDPVAPDISADVPMIIGTNEHEFVNGCDNPEVETLTYVELTKRVTRMFGDAANGIIAAYKEYYPDRSPFDIFAAISASELRSRAITQALRKNALKRANAHEYLYAWRTPVLSGQPGTFHSAEIAMVFNNAAYCDQYTGGGPEAIALSGKMSAAWAGLAKTGSPQLRVIPHWPPCREDAKETMIFNNECKVVSDPEGRGRALIEAAREKS